MFEFNDCFGDHFLPLSDWHEPLLQVLFCLVSQDLLIKLEYAFCRMIGSFFESLDIGPELLAVFVSLDPVAKDLWVGLVSNNMLL
jgi:hypothetical protein